MSDEQHEHINISKFGIKNEQLAKRMQELYKLGISKPKK